MSQKRYQNTSTTRPITDQWKPISESQIGSKTFWLIILQTYQDCGISSKEKSINSKTEGSVPLSLEVQNMIRKKSRLHRAWIRSQNEDNCIEQHMRRCATR